MSIRKFLLSGVLATSLAAAGVPASASGATLGGSSDNDNLIGFAVLGAALMLFTIYSARQAVPALSTRGAAPSGPKNNTHQELRSKGRVLMEF